MPKSTSVRQKNQLSWKKQQKGGPGYRQLFQGMPNHLYSNLKRQKGAPLETDLKKTSKEVSQLYRNY